MSEGSHNSSRRGFMRGAAIAALFGTATMVTEKSEAQHAAAEKSTEDIAVLGKIAIDRELYGHDEILSGLLRFLRPPKSSIQIQWVDSTGRIAGEKVLLAPSSLAQPLEFSFDLRHGLTYLNSIRVKVGGVTQAVTSRFMRSPALTAWDNYQAITWARYPDGYYDQLRDAGVNATMVYRDSDFSNALDNNFNFYVEQTAWEVFSTYHKHQPEWIETLAKVRSDRSNLQHWVRKPCVNDPATWSYLGDHLRKYVQQHRAFKPLYYTIADELGQGDQVSANDFCHSEHCTKAFAEYLRKKYKLLQDLGREWGLSEAIEWDDEAIKSGTDWQKSRLMINRTTTDVALESVALAHLVDKYGTISQFNKEWGTSFPEPGGGMVDRDTWEPVLGAVRESLSLLDLSESTLEKALGPLDQFNARCGKRAGWNAPHIPLKFRSWSEVRVFFVRYDKEMSESPSTKGWNASAWCDFRNFMDSTFADAVLRAAEICKGEDPNARCATEGGQSPFAFGWYNYEQVVRAVDVLELYNIGNNLEVARSLKPELIILSTEGYDHDPKKPLTAGDRIGQHQAARAVWWKIFHSVRGAVIWDNQEDAATFVDLKTGRLTASADAFKDAFHEFQSGLVTQLVNSHRTHDGIAIHYSQPSIQAHWLLENSKKYRDWMVDTVGGYIDSRFVAVRNSWTKLIEDLQLQYNFVSSSQIASGELNSGEYRVLIMPESIAVSTAEAAAIREFVQGGGVVVADCRAAHLNDRCRDLGGRQLDDVFGIAQGAAKTVGAAATGVASEGSLDLGGKDLGKMEPVESTLKTTTGKALAKSGDVPMCVVNRLGSGHAVYLNADLSGYAFDRLNPKASSSIPDLLEGILKLAGVRARVRVLGTDGKRVPGTEVVIFKNGACELVAIFRNPQFDDGGWGSYATRKLDWRDWTTNADNSIFEKEAEITVEWEAKKPTYDVRGKKSIGLTQSIKTILSPWDPLVFTRVSSPLPELQLTTENCVAGSMANLMLTSEQDQPAGTTRVVRVDVLKPSGEEYGLYGQNVVVESIPHAIQIPIAFNDPIGKWRLRATDLLSGRVMESYFAVNESTHSLIGG